MTLKEKIKRYINFCRIHFTLPCLAFDFPLIGAITHSSIETGWGASELAKKYNNYFGMKIGSGTYWQHGVNLRTFEETTQGARYYINDDFCVYPFPAVSCHDYLMRLSSLSRYRQAWAERYNPLGFITGLRDGGYFTATKYVQIYMSRYNLIKENISIL